MDILQLSFWGEVRGLPSAPQDLPDQKPRSAKKESKPSCDASQIAIWEVYRGPGRPTDKPWGCPASIWGTIQKRRQRGKADWNPSDVISLVEKRARVPMGQRKRRIREEDPAPRLVIERTDVIVYPASTCSPITARMVQDGRMAGLRWVPDVGAVRTIQVRKLL